MTVTIGSPQYYSIMTRAAKRYGVHNPPAAALAPGARLYERILSDDHKYGVPLLNTGMWHQRMAKIAETLDSAPASEEEAEPASTETEPAPTETAAPTEYSSYGTTYFVTQDGSQVGVMLANADEPSWMPADKVANFKALGVQPRVIKSINKTLSA